MGWRATWVLGVALACNGSDPTEPDGTTPPGDDDDDNVGTGFADADGDGYGATVDCDDSDPNIHPTATEVLEDGIDQDCDGADAIGDGSDDEDHDGFTTATDCDDHDPTVYPGAPETASDGVDQDCDSVDTLALADLGAGDLLLTEVMNDPLAVDDAYGEWIEVYNASGSPVDIEGLEVSATVAALTFTITVSAPVPVDGYAVLVRDADTVVNGGVVGVFDYRSDLSLSNDLETLTLSASGTTFDEVVFDDQAFFPDSDGAAMALDPDHTSRNDNDNGQYWCLAETEFGAGDFGTPGAANDACPDLGDGDSDGFVLAHDCDDGDAAIHPTANESGGDGVDSDCDGADNGVGNLAVGDLVITEIMNNPLAVDDSNGEWFEVLNLSGTSVNLEGLLVDDGAGVEQFTVDAPTIVVDGERAVFAVDGDEIDNGGVAPVAFDFPGTSFGLGNGADGIRLRVGNTAIDAVAWDGGVTFLDLEGASLMLDSNFETAAGNDNGARWCASTARIAGPMTDFGTPAAPNGRCP